MSAPAWDPVRRGFVVADARGEPGRHAAMPPRAFACEFGLAGAKHDQLHRQARQFRQGIECDIEALLRHQSADHADQRNVAAFRQTESALQHALVFRLAGEARSRIRLGETRVVRGIPFHGVDAIEDAAEYRGAVAQQAVEAAAVCRRLDFACVGGAHGGQPVGKRETALDEGELAVELERFMGPERRRQPERHEMVVGKQPRVREIVDGEHGRRSRFLERQQRRHEAALPVVAVHDVRAPR